MTWSAGTYSRSDGTSGCANDEAGGIGITSAKMDYRLNEITTGINTCLTKDGENSPTADISWGGKKITSLANGAATADAINMGQFQAGSAIWGGVAGGTSTALTLSLTPAISAYYDGFTVRFRANGLIGNTPTLNINGLGAKSMVESGGGSIRYVTGTNINWIASIPQNAVIEAIYVQSTDKFYCFWKGVEIQNFDWTATQTGGLTFTSVTTDFYTGWYADGLCNFKIRIHGTVGGSAYTGVRFTSPVPISGSSPSYNGYVFDAGANVPCVAIHATSTIIEVSRYNNANFTAGTVYLNLEGRYAI